MTAWLERYLDLAALDPVGSALLDPRPAFVGSGEGAAFGWANAAGLRLLRARTMAELSERTLGEGNRLRTEIARLSRTLPSDRNRLEALPFPMTPWEAACRRLNLADGTRAVLAIGRAPSFQIPLAGRAEQLVAVLAGAGDAVAVLDDAGRILGASRSYDPATADETATVAFHADGVPLRLIVVQHARAWPPTRIVPPASAAPAAVAAVPSLAPESAPPIAVAPSVARPIPPAPAEPAAPAPAPLPAATPPAERAEAPAEHPETTLPVAPPVPAAAESPAATIASPAESPPPVEATPLPEAAPLSTSDADAFQRIREALVHNGARAHLLLRMPPPPPPVAAAPAPPPPVAAAPAPPPPAPAPPPPFDLTLLDRLPVGIVVFRDGRVLFTNRALRDLLGFYSTAAFVEAGGVDVIFADGNRAWAAGDFDDDAGRLAVRAGDGRTVPVESRLNTILFEGATALMLSVNPRPAPIEVPAPEVADPTAAERRILELETILNTAIDGVVIVDRQGIITSMNRAAEALFAVDIGDFRGKSFTELLAEESRRTALDYLDGLAANGVKSVLNDGREVIGRVPHGGLIPLYMSMGRLGDGDRFSAVLRDITHWKTIEEEMTAARREAEAANAQKSEFLAKISHEIRTPLNAIIGFSEIMMEQRFGPIGNDRYRDYLSDIHVSGAHLMSLINDLLDLSKIEAGKVDLTFEAVPLNATIQECVALMQPLANRERIIIRTSLSTDLPSVVADQRSFRQILLNLLSNAIKFTRAGGQVIVSTLFEPSGEVVVRIRDTGIGMTAKEIETAMKPFEQVATAQADREKGTGLGLPLTKAMVEANRAAFALESAPNQGTLVRITFPTTRVLAG